MRVTGTSAHEGDGVDVIVRMSGSAYDSWAGFEEITVRSCFTVRVSPASRWREDPDDGDCPEHPALTFAPPVRGSHFDPQDCLLARVVPGATEVRGAAPHPPDARSGRPQVACALDPAAAPH